MTTPPIATSSFLRRWRRLHRRETGEVLLRHAHLARTLALASMSPQQVAIVTAYLAQVERAAFCCNDVAEHVAASLRPDLFAHVIREALFDGQPPSVPLWIPRVPDDVDVDDVEKAIIRRAKSLGVTRPDAAQIARKLGGDMAPGTLRLATVTPSRKNRKP